ncbi:MAG: ribosomal protein S18-alanine N-acetyltransferase [Actinomycetota bacterium]
MRRSTGTLEPEAADIEITPMRRRHVRGVMAIERQVYPRPWSQSLFLSEIRLGPSRVYLVALAAGEVVGYGGMMWHGEECHITTLAVDPEWRRRKVGSRVLHVLVVRARELGADSISLEVRTANWPAQRMYGQFGFRPIGVRKGYYQETGEDALIMWVDEIRSAAYSRLLARLTASIPRASEDRA